MTDLVKMRSENDGSAAHVTDVGDTDCSKSKTRSCKPIWILMISTQLRIFLVFPADVATKR